MLFFIFVKKPVLPKGLLTILLLLISVFSSAQYYIRGDVKDANNEPLQNVKIYRPSARSIYNSGMTGGFGILSSALYDSLIFTKEGYDTVRLRVKTDEYLRVVMATDKRKKDPTLQKMISFTTNGDEKLSSISIYDGETYSSIIENNFVKTTNRAQTTFGLRIDKASYSNIRRFINQQMQVPPDAVRLDEMLNYFNFNYKEPDPGKTFCTESQVTDCPWNQAHRLLFLNISARRLDLSKVLPSNFVFLIDVSGSMDFPNRLPLIKQAFKLFVENLRPIDTVSIVTYGGTVGIWLTPTSGGNKDKILKSIEELNASGDTPGEAAIRTAYQLANNTFIKGGNNRIILATDGDFNIGQTSEKDLEELIEKEKKSGIYLTCLGVGMGNYKDSKIEILAKKGNGNFAYIDDIHEAEKVMVLQFTQTMYAVARDVYVNVKFDSTAIRQYRLLGYDNRKSGFENFIGEPEGGEIGSGAGNTILFELEPKVTDSALQNSFVGSITIHYKNTRDTSELLKTYNCFYNYRPFDQVQKCLQFATAVAMLGLKLRQSEYFPDVSWDTIKKIASKSIELPNDYLKDQFLTLTEDCKKIYGSRRRKNR